MSLWEYCEVAWTPKQVIIHIYSAREEGRYEGVLQPKEWGTLLAQLGADGWELVGVLPTRPANHSLYYFKRPLEAPDVVEWKKRERDTARKQTTQVKEQN